MSYRKAREEELKQEAIRYFGAMPQHTHQMTMAEAKKAIPKPEYLDEDEPWSPLYLHVSNEHERERYFNFLGSIDKLTDGSYLDFHESLTLQEVVELLR